MITLALWWNGNYGELCPLQKQYKQNVKKINRTFLLSVNLDKYIYLEKVR